MALKQKEKLKSLIKAALDKKAIDLIVLDVRTLLTYTDYIVICAGDSVIQVQAIARYIEEEMKKKGIRAFGIEGVGDGNWALMDYNDIVFHIFYEPIRYFYDIEGIYPEVPRYRFNPDDEGVKKVEGRLFAT